MKGRGMKRGDGARWEVIAASVWSWEDVDIVPFRGPHRWRALPAMSEPPSTGRGVGSRGGRGRGRQPGRRGSGGAGRAGNAGSQAAGLPEWQAPYVWACPTCTFFNETQPHRCEMCGTPNAERPWPGGGAASGGGGGAAAEGRGGGLSRRALQAKSRREAAAALLNFRHAAPPPGASSAAVASPPVPRRPAGRPFSRGADHHNPAVSSPALSKLHFLQANFHLLCAAGSSLTRGAIHSATGRSAIAAAAAAWEECRAVRLAATHALQCPVCLVEGPPAAHVGSCGHVICLPCALRLFALAREEDRLSRCPICAEILLLADLRSVVLLRVADARTGESIVFRKLFLGGEGGDAGREARASGGEGGASALSAAAAPFVPSVAGAMLATPAGATHTLHTAAPVPAAMVATALPTPALTTPALANTAAAAAASPSTDAAGNTPAAAPDARSPGTAGAPPPTADAPVIGSPTFAPPAPPRGPLYPDYESVPPVIATGASSVASFRSLLDASLDELRTQEAAIWEEARISAEVASAVAHAARADATTPGGRPSVPSGRGGAGEAKSGAGIAKSGAREAKSGCNEAKSSAGETRSGSAWGAGGLPDVGSPNYRSREPGVPPVGVPGEFPTTPNIANRWAAGGGARLAGALAPPPPPPPAPAAVSWPGDERLLRAAAASAAREAAWAARGGAAGGGGGGGDGGGAAAEGAGGGGVLSPEQEEDVRYIRLAVKEMQARRRAWETQDGNGPDRNGRDRNDADRNGRDRNGTDRNGRDRNRHERNGQDRNSHRRGERAGVAAAAALPPRAVEGGARVAKGERMAGGSGVGRRAESAGGMAGAAGEGLAEKVGMAGGVGLASADAGMPRMKSENRTAEARGTLGAGGVAGSGVGSGADGGASLRAGGDASNASDGGVACTGASDGSAVDASSGVASAPESTTEGRYALQDASGAFLFADPLSVRMLLEQHGERCQRGSGYAWRRLFHPAAHRSHRSGIHTRPALTPGQHSRLVARASLSPWDEQCSLYAWLHAHGGRMGSFTAGAAHVAASHSPIRLPACFFTADHGAFHSPLPPSLPLQAHGPISQTRSRPRFWRSARSSRTRHRDAGATSPSPIRKWIAGHTPVRAAPLLVHPSVRKRIGCPCEQLPPSARCRPSDAHWLVICRMLNSPPVSASTCHQYLPHPSPFHRHKHPHSLSRYKHRPSPPPRPIQALSPRAPGSKHPVSLPSGTSTPPTCPRAAPSS